MDIKVMALISLLILTIIRRDDEIINIGKDEDRERIKVSYLKYLIFKDPLERYTHLTTEKKQQLTTQISENVNDKDSDDFKRFISQYIPNTFNKKEFIKLGSDINELILKRQLPTT